MFQIFLNPLHELLGDDYGRDTISARILRVCITTAEKSFLHGLGTILSIKEWEEDFKQGCFVGKKNKIEPVYYKKVIHEKVNAKNMQEPNKVHAKEMRDKIVSKESDGEEASEQIPEDKEGDPTTCHIQDQNQKSGGLFEEEISRGNLIHIKDRIAGFIWREVLHFKKQNVPIRHSVSLG